MDKDEDGDELDCQDEMLLASIERGDFESCKVAEMLESPMPLLANGINLASASIVS